MQRKYTLEDIGYNLRLIQQINSLEDEIQNTSRINPVAGELGAMANRQAGLIQQVRQNVSIPSCIDTQKIIKQSEINFNESLWSIIDNYVASHPALSIQERFLIARIKSEFEAINQISQTLNVPYPLEFAKAGCVHAIASHSPLSKLSFQLEYFLTTYNLDKDDCIATYNCYSLPGKCNTIEDLEVYEDTCYKKARLEFITALGEYLGGIEGEFKNCQLMINSMGEDPERKTHRNYFISVYQAATLCLTDPTQHETTFPKLKALAANLKPELTTFDKGIMALCAIVAIVGAALSIALTCGASLPVIVSAITPTIANTAIGVGIVGFFATLSIHKTNKCHSISETVDKAHDEMKAEIAPGREHK